VADNTSTAYFVLTNGSATVTLGASEATLSFTEDMIGRAVTFAEHATIYRIESVESGTSLTLNRPFLGTTQDDDDGATAYSITQDRYVLPSDFDRPTDDWESFFGSSSIDVVGPNTFLEERRNRGASMLVGEPERYTVYGLDDSETYQIIHFDPYPSDARVLTFTYQKNHPVIETDEDKILFPRSHEVIILEAMLHLANRDYQDSSKVEMVLRDFMRTVNQAQGAGNVSQDRLRFTPNGRHRIAQYSKWGRGGRIDWGDTFDQANRIGFY